MIAQTPYQNMIYSQPQMAYTPQMYNPWTTRPQSQVQPMPVEQPQQVMQPQLRISLMCRHRLILMCLAVVAVQ